MNASIAATPLLGIAGLFASTAHAGGIDVDEHPDFGGSAIALRDAKPGLSRVGFNDRSASGDCRDNSLSCAGLTDTCVTSQGFR